MGGSLVNPDYDFSSQDWKSARQLIPLQNSFWLHRILSDVPNWAGLPDKSKARKDKYGDEITGLRYRNKHEYRQ